jgi:hypothetical protein
VGAVVVILVATLDLRGAIGFSSFAVLAYYAVANASASTLTAAENRPARWIPILGLAGCITLAITLPLSSALAGTGVLIIGAVIWLIRHSGQAGRKLSRTFRSGLSALVSTSTTLCQVPSVGRPLSTGSVSAGDMKAGSTWSRPWPRLPCRCR